ncbi:MAG TPA: TolC family protein [Pyrinomonadaceae bacterium]|nr:TolC family protein [Pyrinomonadaceae bacterium]
MLNRQPRALFKLFLLSALLLMLTQAAFAQAPRPSPTPNPATLPPGTLVPNPNAPQGQQTSPTSNPESQRVSPTRPPSQVNPQTQTPPAATQPTPNPSETPSVTGEPEVQEPTAPNFPNVEQRPLPPVPNMTRLGVTGDNVLTLTMTDAIKRALENNNDIEVARDDVRFAETQLKGLQGVYDLSYSITPTYQKSISPVTFVTSGAPSGKLSTSVFSFDPTLSKQFGKGGGFYELRFNNSKNTTSAINSTLNPFFSSNLSLSITQPLQRNRSIDNNRRQIRIQRKRLEQSDADFRLRTIDVITQVQRAYWDLVFALRDQQNQLENLNLTRENLRRVEAQIAVGTKAPLERAEVQTELANRESTLLVAVQGVSIAENNLKQLIFKDSGAPEWGAQVTPTDTPKFDASVVNLNDALREARENRPELRRLRLQNDINHIDLTYFKNQMRPQVDLTATLATTGLAGTPCNVIANPNCSTAPAFLQGGYGKDLRNLTSLDTRNFTIGFAIQFPFQNTTAKANFAGAQIQREQLEASIRSQDQLIEVDVRNSAQAVETSRRRVLAAREARANAEMQLEGEQRLYQVGRSTTFLLFQRENALTNARNAELRAETDYNKALADLQRATSTTLRANNVMVETP